MVLMQSIGHIIKHGVESRVTFGVNFGVVFQKWKGGGGTSGFFCPSEFSSPHFYEYTNDEPLKTNFRFIDPTPSPQKRTRLKINHILVQFLHRDLFFS